MNIYYDINNVNHQNIHFYKPVSNKIPHYKYFYKLLYDDKIFTLNTLIINVNLTNYIVEEMNTYNVTLNYSIDFLESIKVLEQNILKKLNSNKISIFNCYKYMLHNKTYILPQNTDTINVTLRISGIWETDTTIGLTTKLYINNYPLVIKIPINCC